MTWSDEDSQPLNRFFNQGRRTDRNYDELIGIIRGVVADGKVCDAEAKLLASWCLTYGIESGDWPAGIIIDRLNRIYEDGVATEDELEDLRLLLLDIITENVEEPTPLPLTKPHPEVIFDQNVFVFTGKFATGTRNHCFKETMLRGGICEDSVNLRVDYLVIGSVGSRDWAHTAWGRKIERAVELQRSKPIAIISEERWASFLL